MSTVDINAPAEQTRGAPLAGATRWRDLLALTRPEQWTKNLLVVTLPLLYPAIWTPASLGRLALAVLVFTMASAAVYIGNDLADLDRDRRHSGKRQRPLAAGLVSPRLAIALGTAILGALAVVVATAAPYLAWPISAYLVLNAAYSAGLRNLPMIDVFIVALGFELRIAAGYLATGVPLRGWLPPSVFLLCLALALGKRRRELDQAGPLHRPALRSYTAGLLDQLLVLSAGLATVTFLLFLENYLTLGTDSGPGLAVLVLIPPALLGLFRYLQVVATAGGGADPVRTLLRDKLIVFDALLCLAILFVTRAMA